MVYFHVMKEAKKNAGLLQVRGASRSRSYGKPPVLLDLRGGRASADFAIRVAGVSFRDSPEAWLAALN